ncbi:MAG: anaerobic ribonucleoside triphosphate reductase, partial [Candidatus Spyradenecus sp.]
MIKTVIKRDGRQVPFNLAKIATAIVKALAQTRTSEQLRDKDDFELEALANKLAEEATRKVTTETPDIEQIQDAVERVLMDNNLPDTAKSYILYRADRSRARERNTKLMRTLADIVHSSAKDSDVKRENANIDGDTAMGSMLKFGSESSKQFYIDNMLRPEVARAHEQGDIHIHDLDFYSLTMTCCQIDLVDLLSRGFSTGHGFLRAPKDIRSFAALACIAIQSNQNDQHGGQAVPNFDYAMAIGVRMTYARHYKAAMREAIELLCDPVLANDITLPEPPTMAQADDPAFTAQEAEALKAAGVAEAQIPSIQAFARAHALKGTDRDTYQAMEALVHNLNSMHSRAGAQTPFSSINYGTDTSLEGRMVMKNLLLTTQAGLGDGETPIFPIQIFRVKKGVNFDEGDPNYDLFKLACEVSAKRLFPNFAFQDAPFNAKLYREGHPETEISYMGCRTRIGDNVYDPDKSQVWKRGNLSFTSINLPRLAIQSHGSLKTFYAQLDDMLQLVRDQLLDRFEVQASKHVRNFPFLMGEGIWLDSEKLGPDDEVREVIKHGSLTFGFIGLAETLKSLIGKHHGESEEAQQLGLEIVKHMRDYADQCARETGLNFTLIATPAEGLSGRFVRMDKKRFGVIPEVTDRDYYTNSFHVPVYYP